MTDKIGGVQSRTNREALVPRRDGGLAHTQPGRSLTYPQPKELFSVNVNEPKRVKIIMALTRLAAVIKQTVDEGLLGAMADNLDDLSDPGLALAFAHLEKTRRTLEGMPEPAEIRDIVSNLTRESKGGSVVDQMAALRKERDEHPERFVGMAELSDFAKTALKRIQGGE